jgi:hypothetical protein
MEEKELFLAQLSRTFENGYGVFTANNSCGYGGIVTEPEFLEEIANAKSVRRIEWDSEEFLQDFADHAERYDCDGNEANVWCVDEGDGYFVQVLTYQHAYE